MTRAYEIISPWLALIDERAFGPRVCWSLSIHEREFLWCILGALFRCCELGSLGANEEKDALKRRRAN